MTRSLTDSEAVREKVRDGYGQIALAGNFQPFGQLLRRNPSCCGSIPWPQKSSLA